MRTVCASLCVRSILSKAINRCVVVERVIKAIYRLFGKSEVTKCPCSGRKACLKDLVPRRAVRMRPLVGSSKRASRHRRARTEDLQGPWISCGGLWTSALPGSTTRFMEPVALTANFDEVAVMHQPVEKRRNRRRVAEEFWPITQWAITTNMPFAQWQEVFPSAGCVVSLVDRPVHRSEVIAIEGKSNRLKETEERSERNQRRRRTPKALK